MAGNYTETVGINHNCNKRIERYADHLWRWSMDMTMTERSDNVIDLFSSRRRQLQRQERVIRMAPENDGMCMLYSNQNSNQKLFCVNILCWGLKANGEVDGMVPWLNRLTPARDIRDSLAGHFEGYYDPSTRQIFTTPPRHKIMC